MTRTSEFLADLTTKLAFESIKDCEWSAIKKVNLPALSFNPYAYIDIGTILGSGEREHAIKTITVYWDGSVLTRNHV